MYETKEHRLTFPEKLSFALGELPNSMSSILAAFLTMYYTDSIGMAAGAVGTMFFISKLFDGVTDLLAGNIVDQTRTKWGKARPWLLWLCVPTGLSLALIFFIPSKGSASIQLIYAFVTYNLYNSVMFTMVGCAKNCLMALMTQNASDRMSLSKYNTLFGLGAVMVGSAITFPFINKMGGNITAWKIVFSIYGLATTLCLLFAFCNSKEYVESVEQTVSGETKKVPFMEKIKLLFSNKYFIFALIINVLVNFAVQINSASQTFFYTYTMDNVGLTTSMNLVSLIPMILGLLFFAGPCMKYFGKKGSFYIGASGHCLGSVICGISALSGNVTFLAVGLIVKNICSGPMSVPVGILVADSIDYGEFLNNRRLEGTGTAAVTFSQKISSGLASGCVGWILSLTGYIANAPQSDFTIAGINFMFCYMPLIAAALCMIGYRLFYHYDQEEEMVLSALNARKNG